MARWALVRWRGLAVALGGVLWGVVGLFTLELMVVPAVSETVETVLIAAMLLLLLLGAPGLHSYQQRRGQAISNRLGWIGSVTIAVGLVLALGLIVVGPLLSLFNGDAWWDILTLGIILLGLGSALFVLAALVARVLPRLGALGLLVGSLSPLLVVYTDGTYRLWESSDLRYWLFVIVWLLYGASWIVLGSTLWADKQQSLKRPFAAG